MAAASSTSATLRISFGIGLDHYTLQRSFESMGVCRITSWRKCNVKSLMFRGGPLCGRRNMGPLAMASSVEVDAENQEDAMIFGSSYSRRYEKLNDLEIELQGLFKEVKDMVKMGKEGDAIDLLEANYEAVREQIDSGGRSIEEAAILDVIALGYMAVGDLRIVHSILDELNRIIDGLKDDEPLLDSILMHAGSMWSKLEKFETSIFFYERSLEIMERKYGNNSLLLTTPLLGMAKVLGLAERTVKAIEIYQRVITLLESSRGEYSEELSVPLSALGHLLIKEARVLDAEYAFSRVIDIYVKSYGKDDGRVGLAMCSLAQAKCAKGDVKEAIDLYKEAIRVLECSKYMALDDKVMEKLRIELAELLHVTGRVEEGRTILEECLLITKKHKGKEHPSSVPHLLNLATSHSRSKNFAEAERLLRISLQIMLKNVSPEDPSVSFPMLHLAVTLYNLHRDEEAEKLACAVLRIREKTYGKESVPVGEALDCLVSIQSRLGKDDNELLELLKRVLKIQEKTFGHDSEEVMETLKKIVHCLDKLEMKTEKYPLERRLSILRNKYKRMVRY